MTVWPDLVLRSEGKDLAVGDAKYKDPKPGEWPHVDLYQLLAYCMSLGLPAGLLIYASDRPLERHVVERAGTSFEIVGLEMAGSPRSLEARMREAAGRLVQQAAHQRARYKVAG